MNLNLENKSVVVTGGSRGIGLSIVEDFQISPDKKVKVACCYDFEGNINEIVEEIF